MTKETKNIFQRLSSVMNYVRGVNLELKKVNGQYPYVKHDAVTGLLHPAFVDHGIVFTVSVEQMIQEGNRTVVKLKCQFVNIDNPKDLLEVFACGYGICSQDKGPGKAISYAVKYCLLKNFCLETGQDIEKDNIDFVPEDPCLSPNEVTFLNDLLAEDQEAKDKLLKFYKVKSFDKLKKSEWHDIVKASSNYIKKEGENNAARVA